MLSYMLKLLDATGPDEVAAAFGISKITTRRWSETRKVPKTYLSDFKRLEGKSGLPIDQFYTDSGMARHCMDVFERVAKDLKVNLGDYTFIEPSAGEGSFFEKFPPDRRIGLDVEPRGEDIEQGDYLLWEPPFGDKYVVVGNPPFGVRGHAALNFLNHSAKFADLMAFILPPSFASSAKSSLRRRVDENLHLVYSEAIPDNAFHTPDGAPVPVNCVFQIWAKASFAENGTVLAEDKTCKSYVSIYFINDREFKDEGGGKSMGLDKVDACDVYLPSTCFKGMHAYTRAEQLPYHRGYGIVIHNEKEAIKELLMKHDWRKTAFAASNGALNLRTSIIEDFIINAGYVDEVDRPVALTCNSCFRDLGRHSSFAMKRAGVTEDNVTCDLLLDSLPVLTSF